MVQKHLIPLIDTALNPISINIYSVVLKAQRSNHPHYPKLNKFFPYSAQIGSSFPEVSNLEIGVDDYVQRVTVDELGVWEYTGVYSIDTPLYPDSDETTFYQFIDKRVGNLTNWRYIYIPISYQEDLILAGLLPSINFYDASTFNSGTIYPEELELIRIDDYTAAPSFFTNIPNTSYSHPFYPDFYFTGSTVTFKKELVYEYVDFRGYYDIPYTYYYSRRRPLELEYPYGRVTDLDLETRYIDSCYPNSIGQAPTYLEYTGVVPPILSFEYRNTNRVYSPNHIWYLYTGSSQTLLQSPPHELAKPFIEKLYIDEGITIPGLTLLETQVYNNQSISFSQTSNSASESLIFDEIANP